MVWPPTDSAEVGNVAIPLLSSVSVPSVVLPSVNVTVPVGVPDPEVGLTVAVNVTFCPATDVPADEVTAVVVFVRMEPAGSFTTRALLWSATYTFPALSTATPDGKLRPVNAQVTCWLELVAPAGSSTTRLWLLSVTYTFPEA